MSDSLPPMTDEELHAAAELLDLDFPGTLARSERTAVIAAVFAAGRRLLDEVKRLNREFADFRQMAVLNSKAATEAVDRSRLECAALAAKVGEGEEEWAIRVVTEPGGTYSYHDYCDPENPERDLESTLRVLADGHDGYGNPVPHGPVSIVKRTVWSTEWETVEPSGMPHTPAQAAPDSEMDEFEAADDMYRRWE